MATLETGKNILPVRASRKEVITVFNQVYELSEGRAGKQGDLTQREFAVMRAGRQRLVGSDSLVPEDIKSDRFILNFRDPVQNRECSLREGISIRKALDALNQNLDELGVDIAHSTQDPKTRETLRQVFATRFRQLQVLEAYSSPSELVGQEREARIRLEAFENFGDPLRDRGEEQNWLDGEEVVDRFVFINFPKDGKNFGDFLLSLLPNKPNLANLQIERPLFPSFKIEPLTSDETRIPDLGSILTGLKDVFARGRERVCRVINGALDGISFVGGDDKFVSVSRRAPVYKTKRSPEYTERKKYNGIVPIITRGRERLANHKCKKACCIPLALLGLAALLALCTPRDSINKPATELDTTTSHGKLGGHPVDDDSFSDGGNKLTFPPKKLRPHHYTNQPGPDGSFGSLKGQSEGMLAEVLDSELTRRPVAPDDDLLHQVLTENEKTDPVGHGAYLRQYMQDTVSDNPVGTFDGDKIMAPDFVSPDMRDEVILIEKQRPHNVLNLE